MIIGALAPLAGAEAKTLRPHSGTTAATTAAARPRRAALIAELLLVLGGDGRAVFRLGEEHLDVGYPPAAESALAVGEVELPHPLEGAVVAERADALELGEEVLAPAAKRVHVVRGYVLERDRAQVRGARDGAADDRQRRQAATGEDVRVGEAALGLLDAVGALVDRDRLQEHRAMRLQQRRAAFEEGVEVLPANGLDHLDRDELVEAAAEVAIVREEHRHPLAEPGRRDPLAGQPVLLRRDRRGRHLAAV